MDGEGEIPTSLTGQGIREECRWDAISQIMTSQVDLECRPNNEPLFQHGR